MSVEGSIRRWLWVLLVVLIGFAHPNEARVQEVEEDHMEVVVRVGTPSVLVSPADDACVLGQGPVDDAVWQYFSGIVKICLIVSLWEILRWVRRLAGNRRPVQRKTASSQTRGEDVIFLPLAEGIPNRAEILFSLWQAGYQISG